MATHITNLSVDGLAFKFDYNLKFSDIDSDIIFITGPNGYGKTILLRLIYKLLNIKPLRVSYFKNAELKLSNDGIITVDEENYNKYFKNIDFTLPSVQYMTDDLSRSTKHLSDPIETYGRISQELIDKFNKWIEKPMIFGDLHYIIRHDKTIRLCHDDGRIIWKVTELSSGMRQYMTILYTLLEAHIRQSDIILIDSIENFLHIGLQIDILELIKDLKLDNSQIIITTHSPEILAHKWDHTIDLFDITEEK